MTDPPERTERSETSGSRLTRHSSARRLRYTAAGLAYVVAGMHLFHPKLGVSTLVVRLSMDPGLLVADPRPAAFVLSGVAIVAGVTAAILGAPRKPLYAIGIVLVGTYVVGYLGWHLSGHGGFLPGREPLHHGLQPHEAVLAHLTGNPLAATALVAETILIGVLVALWFHEP